MLAEDVCGGRDEGGQEAEVTLVDGRGGSGVYRRDRKRNVGQNQGEEALISIN